MTGQQIRPTNDQRFLQDSEVEYIAAWLKVQYMLTSDGVYRELSETVVIAGGMLWKN